MKKKNISLVLALILFFSVAITGLGETFALDQTIDDVATYLLQTVSTPQVGAVGGEWVILGLARSGYEVPKTYYQNYYRIVEKLVKDTKGELHPKKYTEYSRLIMALTAIGADPSNVGGYNLLLPLGDYEKIIWQGLNGPIWALLALDSGNYEIPHNPSAKIQGTRERYINRILESQMADGGFSLLGGLGSDLSSDPDITGMALQALAKYQDREEVKKATEKALDWLSKIQEQDGGFGSYDVKNSESVAQVLVALGELGISYEDERFVKNNHTLLQNLLTYYRPQKGFDHLPGGSGTSLMATEQGFHGLIAVHRFLAEKHSFYTMKDALFIEFPKESENNLPSKHPQVKMMPIKESGKTFSDIQGDPNQEAILALAKRGIISGKGEDRFDPQATMTRGEFATIVVQGLGLTIKEENRFSDVEKSQWFFPYVNTAASYGIVKGLSETQFAPFSTITREEAAVMITRAAVLCGLDPSFSQGGVRDALAGFIDYVVASSWAMESLAFCYEQEILDSSVIEIKPHEPIKRGEIARMLFQMLKRAQLI